MPRYALYYCPSPGSALWQFGSTVLGYDAVRATIVAHPALPGASEAQIVCWSRAPGRYGFHATLKAPFHLRSGMLEDQLIERVEELVPSLAPVELGRLQIAPLGDFIALVPAETSDEIAALASRCVEHFEPMRAPLAVTDRERRLAAGLTARQSELLESYGYPYVHDEFRFHMTLTGALACREREVALGVLRAAYQPIDGPVIVDAISLLRQDESDARFAIIGRWSLYPTPV